MKVVRVGAVWTILLFACFGASAQGQAILPGVTVSASSTATDDADVVDFSLRIASHEAVTDAALARIKTALVDAGAEAKSVYKAPEVPINDVRAYHVILVGTVQRPDAQNLQRGVASLISAFRLEPQLVLEDIAIFARRTDCTPLRRRAQIIALRDAHDEARDLAREAGGTLGRLSAVTAYGNGGGPKGRECQTNYSIGANAVPANANLSKYLQVTVYANVTVTYAIAAP